jgi:hypothetical protein
MMGFETGDVRYWRVGSFLKSAQRRIMWEGGLVTLRDNILREAEQKYTARGETVQAVMMGITLRPLLLYTLWWLLLDRDSYRVIVCTDKRILLCKVDGVSHSMESLIDVTERNVLLGPPRSLLMHRISAFSAPIYVARRFYKDIRRADRFVICR